ncbi:hypothetical protein [Anabaena sp. UHCC 0204]|uniref:hypothetical protein n=1 Tax=Anabaena sp. UHCC 0204 TaxID=2590009 RepID=UPI0014466F08|nr:hypothetical protein [Anabaena sp. UHCC 0204]MTJ10962.1 hypothetical protein [Anabaena sp. UHCC 0204]
MIYGEQNFWFLSDRRKHRIAVMHIGKIVELEQKKQIFAHSQHLLHLYEQELVRIIFITEYPNYC